MTDSSKRKNEEIDLNHPAFIQTEVDPLNMSPAMEALQQIKYESGDTRDDAVQYKEEGNYHFARGDYSMANENYTTALKKRFEDSDLRALLYTNRAISHFKLKNYRSSFNDAQFALQWNANYVKAHVRAAHAAFHLKRWDTCRQYINSGLQLAPELKELLQLREEVTTNEKKDEEKQKTRELQSTNVSEQRAKQHFAVKERGISIYSSPNTGLNIPTITEGLVINDEGHFLWPVLFLYPEFGQTDYLQHNEEGVKIETLLSVVFDPNEPPPAWDHNRTYRYGKDLQVYYEIPVQKKYGDCEEEGEFILIPHSVTLGDLLMKYQLPVPSELIIPLHIVSSESSYFTTWLKDRIIRRLDQFMKKS